MDNSWKNWEQNVKILHNSTGESDVHIIFFLVCCSVCGILVSRPGIEPEPLAVRHGVLTAELELPKMIVWFKTMTLVIILAHIKFLSFNFFGVEGNKLTQNLRKIVSWEKNSLKMTFQQKMWQFMWKGLMWVESVNLETSVHCLHFSLKNRKLTLFYFNIAVFAGVNLGLD